MGQIVNDADQEEDSHAQTIKQHESIVSHRSDDYQASPKSKISNSWQQNDDYLFQKSTISVNNLGEVVPPLKPTQETVTNKQGHHLPQTMLIQAQEDIKVYQTDESDDFEMLPDEDEGVISK